MKTDAPPVFLTAEWRHLAMLNYEVDAKTLVPFVPNGTELDLWNGKNYVSVVGFLFQKTRVLGVPIPFHRNFEEVNLRFYVRRLTAEGWRRGVVFIKELVPRMAIAWTARIFYNEPYLALPMSHQIETSPANLKEIKSVRYSWRFNSNSEVKWSRIVGQASSLSASVTASEKSPQTAVAQLDRLPACPTIGSLPPTSDFGFNGEDNFMRLVVRGEAQPLRAGSEEEFITEHYWGCTAQRDGSTLEYQVEHPRWRVWATETAELQCDIAGLYGQAFCGALSARPASAFLAEGSAVTVRKGVRLISK